MQISVKEAFLHLIVGKGCKKYVNIIVDYATFSCQWMLQVSMWHIAMQVQSGTTRTVCKAPRCKGLFLDMDI